MKKQARGDATIKRVLDATLKCFTARDDSIQAISRESDVSIGSLYHHFGSRERIVLRLYQRCLRSMLESLTREVLKQRTASAGVKALVTAYLRWVHRHQAEARLIFAAAYLGLDRDFREPLIRHAAEITAPLNDWLELHIATGAIVRLDPSLYEVVLIGPPAEASRRFLSSRSSVAFARAMKQLPERVWASVRPADGRAGRRA